MTSSPDRSDGSEATGRSFGGLDLAVLTAVSVLFLSLVLPPVFAGKGTMLQHSDMVRYHLPQINTLIANPLDLLAYEPTSATTPGHHILFAWVSVLLGYDSVSETTWVLRVLNALFGLALVATAWWTFWRLSRHAGVATALTLPMVGSNYVLAASIWINTDNGAMLFYALGVYLLLFHPRAPLWAGVCATAMVMWRQIYLPVVGAYVLPVLWPGPWKERIKVAAAAAIPPTILVGAYAVQWGRLTPRRNEFTLNLSVPLHALALTGLCACAYALLLWPRLLGLGKQRLRQAAVGGAALGGLSWLVAASNYDNEAGRWGSLVWLLAKKSPAIGDKTLVVAVLAIAGAFILIALSLEAFDQKRYPPELVMLFGCLAGYSAQIFAWQRYIEPALLLMFGVVCARPLAKHPMKLGWWGPVAMGAVFGFMSELRIWGAVERMFG